MPLGMHNIEDLSDKVRVVIADDEVAGCARVAELLEKESDFEVIGVAHSGQEALQRIRNGSPDLIFLDVQMPGMDGYDLIKELRRIPKLASTPAIALTGFGMKRDTEAALAAGYNAHLCKPVDAKQLSAVIEQLAAKQL